MVKKKQTKTSATRLRRNNSKSETSNNDTFHTVRKKLWGKKKKNYSEESSHLGLPDKEAMCDPTYSCHRFYPIGYFSNQVTSYRDLLLPIDNSFTNILDSYSISNPPKRKRRK